jgi:hypothetical protein
MTKSRSDVRVGCTIGGERSEERAMQVGRMAAQERGASERHRVRAWWERPSDVRMRIGDRGSQKLWCTSRHMSVRRESLASDVPFVALLLINI